MKGRKNCGNEKANIGNTPLNDNPSSTFIPAHVTKYENRESSISSATINSSTVSTFMPSNVNGCSKKAFCNDASKNIEETDTEDIDKGLKKQSKNFIFDMSNESFVNHVDGLCKKPEDLSGMHFMPRNDIYGKKYMSSKKFSNFQYSKGFSSLYEEEQFRKHKILGFLHKDVVQINSPDLRPFLNTNHAYECLLPYHIFLTGTYEDELFFETIDKNTLEDDYIETHRAIDTLFDIIDVTAMEAQGFISELLLFYEQRYLHNYEDNDDQEVVSNKSTSKKVVMFKKRKQLLNRRNTVIRLKMGDLISDNGVVRLCSGKLYFKIR